MLGRQYRKRKRIIRDLKKQNSCVDCNLNVLHLLEFDHIIGSKIHNVSQINLNCIISEAKKCVLRCKNCHRIRTQKYVYKKVCSNDVLKQRNQNFVNKLKIKIGRCLHCEVECNQFNTYMFDFDHLRRYQKHSKISKLVRDKYSLNAIATEIAKCQLLCANCHHLKTLYEKNIFKKFSVYHFNFWK